jgi:cation diffusion facilitator family transporter
MTQSPSEIAGADVRRVLWITLGLNVAVSASKIVVGKLSGSLSMVADGYHSLLDGTNNIVGLVVAALAYAPPDSDHQYGHRKFETAATLGIGAALLFLAYRVIEGALRGVSHGAAPSIGPLNWVVMGLTLGTNLFVASYEAREGRRLGSAYLAADAAHTRSDIYVTLGVVVSFAGVRAGLPWVDGAVAFGIGAFIAVLAVRILIGAFHVLTDRAPIAAEEIGSVVRRVLGVLDCRDVRTRGGPGATYVDLVADVDGGLSLHAAHEVADRIEAAVHASYPDVIDVVVHLEPASRR